MFDFKPKPGAALPFLEAENRRAEQRRAKTSPLTLLEVLAHSKQALPIFDLQGRSGMEPSRYSDALKSLRDAGYIEIDGEALEQSIRLTQRGAEVVRLAEPA